MDFVRNFSSYGEASSSLSAEPHGGVLTVQATTLMPAYVAGQAHRSMVVGLNLEACATGDEERNPLDVVVCLDVSGSMAGEKLKLCKKTIATLLKELRPQDSFALVTFSDAAKTVVPATKATEANKRLIADKVDRVGTEGCTNLSGGLFEAIELEALLVDAGTANAVRSVLLLTDGAANRGISDPGQLVDVLTNVMKVPRATGTSLYCFGYGSDTNAALLRSISQASEGGAYYFVETEDHVASAFADALGGLLSVVAQNVTVRVRVVQGAVVTNCLSHAKECQDVDGIVRIGDLFAEEQRDIVLQVDLPACAPSETPVPVVHFEVFCLAVLAGCQQHFKATAAVARPAAASASTTTAPNQALTMQKLRIGVTAALDEARRLAEAGDLPNARALIQAQQPALRDQGDDPLAKMLLADIDETLEMLATKEGYSRRGAHWIASKAQMHSQQRCQESRNDAELSATNVYRGAKKSKMVAKFLA